jgi:hypothetical protein
VVPADAGHGLSVVGGAEEIKANPFRTGFDFSVFDHLKYIETSTQTFPVPPGGSLAFSADISAETPGTVVPLEQQGIYGPSGTWSDPAAPPWTPDYHANVLEGQQAGVVLNMIDFCTGQLFDWFLAGHSAFTLVERLPSSVTGNDAIPGCPNVALDKMYTQIVDAIPLRPGVHHVRISYSASHNSVEFDLDGKVVTKVNNVGIPLDKRLGSPKYTGTYPSLGPGESLAGQIHAFSIGHGLFSLIDAFPFQYPLGPSVSIPVGTGNPADAGKARLFGQGAIGTFDNFTVTTVNKDA